MREQQLTEVALGEQSLRLGPLGLCLRGDLTCADLPARARPFAEAARPDDLLLVARQVRPAPSPGLPDVDGTVWIARQTERGLWLAVRDRPGAPPLAAAELDPSLTKGTLEFDRAGGEGEPGAWFSPLLQLVAAHAVIRRGGLLVHAACVCVKGKAWLLAGESGAGKTTLARALAARGGIVMADDRSAVFAGPPAAAAGTPWGGELPCAGGAALPLERILFLKKGDAHQVRKLTRTEAATRVVTLCLGPFWNQRMMEQVLAVAAALGSETRCEEASLSGDGSAADWLLALEV